MNYNDINEDVLFKLEQPDVEEDVLFKPTTSEVETEVLFGANSTEELEYIEPQKSNGFDVLFGERNGLSEEILFDTHDETADVNGDVETEVLFKTGVEDLQLNKELEVKEEEISFVEPIKPDTVSEEVLFGADDKPIIEDLSSPDFLSDELLSLSKMGGVAVSLDSDAIVTNKPVYIEKNFAQRMLEADVEIQERYNELKNYMLLFKKVKSRISNDFDSFNMGRTQLIKLGVSGKSLKLYLNLEYDKVETRLKCKDASEKKAYAEVPVFLRIKSPRGMKNAKYLIGKVVERFNLQENPKAVLVDSMKLIEEKAKIYD